MLDLMLGNAPNAFSCGEVSAWFRPWRPHHFKIDCPCGQDPCPVWAKIGDVPESQFYATVIRELQVDFVIDSSKDLSWLVDAHRWASASGIRTFNVLLWKDPVTLSYSHWKRGFDLYRWRKEFVSYYSRIFGLGLPILAVNFGDLVKDPAATLASICAAVGMPYYEGKERFWEKEHHYLFGSGGVRKQVEAGSSTIRARQQYPDEFEAQIASLKERIAADDTVQGILQKLQQADISLHTAGSDDHPPSPLKKPYPLWYYRKRAVRALRRYFPESYEDVE
jgi:hypothetical protein